MVKRLALAALALCFLLCGCSVIRESGRQGEKIPVSALDLSGLEYYGRVDKSAVYFFNETSGTLTAELRTLVIDQDTNPAQAAIEQLLRGPSNESLKGVAPEYMTLESIEFSRGVANIYFNYDGAQMQPRQAYQLELAITNTVTDILGASYICIFYNGARAGFMGYPSAPLRKQTGGIEEAFLNAYARFVPETQNVRENAEQPVETPRPRTSEISTVLYFVSTSGQYILPEVRTIKYTEENYVSALIDELRKGPLNTSSMESPFSGKSQLILEPEFEQISDGGLSLKLYFDNRPVRSEFLLQEEMALSYAALIYTITGFIPNVQRIEIYEGSTLITAQGAPDGKFIRSNYKGYIGSSIPLYFADRNSDLLLEVHRSQEQGRTWSAKARIIELLRGPLEKDGNNVWPVMPSGVTEDDILAVEVYNDTAYVNLSRRFKDACEKLSAKNEMLLVFSLVNTITAMDGISKVQFLVEGEQTMELAGSLCISDPFLRNFGIIKSGG
ncbi:MAG: GerMN domain-containing protein [Christensenellales bacterium]